ncbi:MAG: ribosome biogenesis GTPase Der [Planctomycetota bacterium]
MSSPPRPHLVLVGRPNVGKSSLLNALAHRRIAIVDPTAGVTRDRLATDIEIPATDDHPPLPGVLIDTGGYGIVDRDDLAADVEAQIASGVADADLVLFTVDLQAGITAGDQLVADTLRQTVGNAKPVLLLANKADHESHEPEAWNLMQLGFGDPVPVSAVTKHNLSALHRAIHEKLPPPEQWIESQQGGGDPTDSDNSNIKVALVGKRNAGKSTLTNALAGEDRVIVSEVAGTTRDSVDVNLEVDGQGITLIDTAGVRRTKSLAGDIEYYAQHRSLRSVRRADVCLLLIDAAVPVSQVDHQLVGEIQKHHKPTVIVVNKWDLAQANYTQEQYAEYLTDALRGLSFAPLVFISALKGQGMKEAIALALNLYQQAGHRVGTGELNRTIERILAERGPSASKGGKRAKVYYATQPETHPPTITLFVNDPDLFDHNYQRYLDNRFRDELPYAEVPIQLLIKPRKSMSREERALLNTD